MPVAIPINVKINAVIAHAPTVVAIVKIIILPPKPTSKGSMNREIVFHRLNLSREARIYI